MALHTNNHEVAMKLLHLDDVDPTMPTFEGWTPLHYACDSNMVEEVEFLLENPDVDAILSNSVTGAHHCTTHVGCAIPIVKLLLGRDDIDVNIVEEKLKTP